MTLLDLQAELGRLAASALAQAVGSTEGAPAELPVVRAGKPEFGDLQISACLQLGKPLRKPPRELATIVATALGAHPAIARVEVAGPGFVNLHLRDEWIAERTAALLDDERLGLRDMGRGECVVIDYSSPNVAKPMHIGHIRSTIIGAALDRTLRALGYRVVADNHLGDWGTQFGKLIVAWRRWLDDEAYRADPVRELERLYQKFGEEERRELAQMSVAPSEVEADDSDENADEVAGDKPVAPILLEARRELVKLQAGDAENRALWQRFVDDSRHVFEDIYRRLGVRFDYWLGESAYNEMLPAVIDELSRRGLAKESRGALVVEFPEEEKLPVFIVRKADGGYNYATTDVATMAVRTGVPALPHLPAGPFGAARVIVVTDERQQLHFQQLFAVGRRLGVTARLEHVWFGLMRFWNERAQQWEAGSTRKGNVIHLKDLLDEAERRAAEAAGAHNPELSDEERCEVGRVVGIGAVKYNDLSKDRQTLVSFTWDKALALTGNTAPYLQYAYARIRSIVRKAGSFEEANPGAILLGTPVERSLALRLLGFPEAVEQVARTLRPHLLADYLYDLATAFSGFYADHPVLKAEPSVRASRLALTELVSRVLRQGLALLGIEVLERM